MVIDPFLGDPWKKAPFMGVTSGAHLWWMESNSQLYIYIYIKIIYVCMIQSYKQTTYIHTYIYAGSRLTKQSQWHPTKVEESYTI